MKKPIILLIVAFLVHQANAQLRKNEKLVYTASYNFSGLLTKFAEVTFETEPVVTGKNEYLHFSMQFATFSKWDKIFKMRDIYECYVHPFSLKPTLFFKRLNEASYTQYQKYVFNYEKGTVLCTSQIQQKPIVTTNRKINPATQDIISNLYKLRVMNYNGYPIGKVFYSKLLYDEGENTLYIKYLGVERLKTDLLGTKECIKIAVSGNGHSINSSNVNYVWITNDERRIPVLVKFNLKVGSGQLTLTKSI